jgi:hypothetical protein
MQNHWHDWSDFDRVDYLSYEDPDDDTVAMLTSSGAWVVPLPMFEWLTLPFINSGSTALEFSGKGLAAVDGTWQGSADITFLGRGVDAAVWAGFRYEDGEVGTNSSTLVAVQDQERGPWLIYGASVGSFFLHIGNNLHSGGGMGRLGFAHYRLDPRVGTQNKEILGDLTYSPGPSMGFELMWQPESWSGPWGIACGGHFGNAGISWQDNNVEFRQFAVGPSWNQHLWQWCVFDFDGYAALGLGVREDFVVARGSNAPFGEDDHISMLGTGRGGLRVMWGDHKKKGRTVRMGIGLGAAAYVPFSEGSVSNGVITKNYADPDLRPEASLHALARW